MRFEEREVEQIRYTYPTTAFENVQLTSEWNDLLYRTTLEPWVTAFANPYSATMLKWLHPMRTSRLLFSERLNAWMSPVEARVVRGTRVVANDTDQFVGAERAEAALISRTLDGNRQVRDAMHEALFAATYGMVGRWPCIAMPFFDWSGRPDASWLHIGEWLVRTASAVDRCRMGHDRSADE